MFISFISLSYANGAADVGFSLFRPPICVSGCLQTSVNGLSSNTNAAFEKIHERNLKERQAMEAVERKRARDREARVLLLFSPAAVHRMQPFIAFLYQHLFARALDRSRAFLPCYSRCAVYRLSLISSRLEPPFHRLSCSAERSKTQPCFYPTHSRSVSNPPSFPGLPPGPLWATMGNDQSSPNGLKRHQSADRLSVGAGSQWSTQTSGLDAIPLKEAVHTGDKDFPFVPPMTRTECVAVLAPAPTGSYMVFADGLGRVFLAVRLRDVLLRVRVTRSAEGYRLKPVPDSENAITAAQPAFVRLIDLLLYYATTRPGVSFRLALPCFDLSALQDEGAPPVGTTVISPTASTTMPSPAPPAVAVAASVAPASEVRVGTPAAAPVAEPLAVSAPPPAAAASQPPPPPTPPARPRYRGC